MTQSQKGKDRRGAPPIAGIRLLRNANRGAALLLAGALALAGTYASADPYGASPAASYYVSAPVVNVSPITTERSLRHPVRQCTRETRYSHDRDYRYEPRHRQENLFLPGLFGGLVGGLIGNQFGGGNGKKALTVVGALAGSSIARDAARQRRYDDRPAEICHTTYQTEVVRDVTAYDVTYEYAGQLFEKRMAEHPGNSVRVRVALEPAAGGT
jgi:uncharacterized protein YcfJ